jgi:hypothetical protein
MMPFFGIMACVYFVVVFGWCLLAAWHWAELTTVQGWVSVVLLLGLLENAVKFGDYLSWNAQGHRNAATLAAALVLGVTKRALSRALVVMVSLGYSVVRPSLGLQLFKVAHEGQPQLPALEHATERERKREEEVQRTRSNLVPFTFFFCNLIPSLVAARLAHRLVCVLRGELF